MSRQPCATLAVFCIFSAMALRAQQPAAPSANVHVSTEEAQRESKFHSAYGPAKSRAEDALKRHDDATAVKELEIARAAAEERGDSKWREQATMSAELGNTERDLKDYAEAERFYKESLGLYEKHGQGEQAGAADVMESFANVYAAQNAADKAEPLLLHAVKIYKQGMETASSEKDRAWYGRHIAVSSFWLVAIGTSSRRRGMAQAHCKDVMEYSKWVQADQRDIMTKGCAEVAR